MQPLTDKFVWPKFYQNPSNMPSAFDWLFFWEAWPGRIVANLNKIFLEKQI